MTLLARLQYVGLGKEGTYGTYTAAVRSIPVTGPKPEDIVAPLRDESIRGNDVVVQGIYGGPAMSNFGYTIPQIFPDILGDHLRAIVGPDTLVAGVSTTLSANTSIGATSITTALTIPLGSTVSIGTGATQEFFTSGTPTGAGPFTIPVTAGTGAGGNSLALAHLSAVAVVSAARHTFAQDQRATAIPGYSLTQFNKIESRGYAGSILSDFGLKIDPKGNVSGDAKWMGFPSATQSNVAAAFAAIQPFLGWQWGLTIGGVASTRGLSGDYGFKRATEAINSSDGTQGPREVFPGALELDFKLKAIFENNTDFLQFLGYTSVPIVSTLTQPLAFGGSVLTLTSTGQKFVKFAPDFGGAYLTADIDSTAAMNTTDNGLASISLTNFVNTAY